jgi:hypothetical protein
LKFRRFRGTYCLHLQGRRASQASHQEETSRKKSSLWRQCVRRSISCLLLVSVAYCLTLKMEAVRSSDTSVNFYRTTRRHIPEVSILICKKVFLHEIWVFRGGDNEDTRNHLLKQHGGYLHFPRNSLPYS